MNLFDGVVFARKRATEGWNPAPKNPGKERKKSLTTGRWQYRDIQGSEEGGEEGGEPVKPVKKEKEVKPKEVKEKEAKPKEAKLKEAKPAPSSGHPLEGLDNTAIRQRFLKDTGPTAPEANPWKLKPEGKPKVLNAILDHVVATLKDNVWKRPKMSELLEVARKADPKITMSSFQNHMFKLMQDGNVALGPFTMAVNKIPDDELRTAFPLDKEIKVYVDVSGKHDARNNPPPRYEEPAGKPVVKSASNKPADKGFPPKIGKREFNKLLTGAMSKVKGVKRLDLEKLRAIPVEKRQQMGHYVISHRKPVLVELTEGMDKSWLASSGYMYHKQSKVNPEMRFLTTSNTDVR